MLPDTPHATPDTRDERLQRVREVIDACLVQRAAGHSLSDAALIARYPELMPELDEQLERIRLIAGARERIDGTHGSDGSANSSRGSALDSSIRFQCPNCLSAIPIPDDSSWSKIICTDCGHNLKIVGDDGGATGLQPGGTLGRFELLQCIGSGGFGVVWKARDPQLDRVVALKVPRRGELSKGEVELFFREARAAAQVRHPNIVSIHEVGRDGDAVYLVSEFVDGLPLSDYLKEKRLTTREAATLCRQIAEALVHVHERGIVHRDLKPANVIVTRDEFHGLQPHVTDFGLARRSAREVTVTVDGQLMGTPAYMSPEQASGGGHAAGPATDVYSLGVILFELLTGEPLYRGAPTMVIDQVLHVEPVSPRRLNAFVARDLETITLKCLEKDPGRRYATAQALADDLHRWLHGEPIVARPISPLQRALRWCRRKPVAAALAAMLVVLAVAGPLVAGFLFSLAARESAARRDAETAAGQADAARQAAESSDREKSEHLYVARTGMLAGAMAEGNYRRAEQLFDMLEPQEGDVDLRDFEWYYWRARRLRGLERSFSGDAQTLTVAVSPRGEWLASGDAKGWARLYDVATGAEAKSFPPPAVERSRVFSVCFSPRENLLAIGRNNGTVDLWDIDRRAARTFATRVPWIQCVTISPDGQSLAVGMNSEGKTGAVEVFRLCDPDGRLLPDPQRHLGFGDTTHPVAHIAFSPDSQRMALSSGEYVGGTLSEVIVWDVETGKPLAKITGRMLGGLAFSRDGRRLFIIDGSRQAVVEYDWASGKPLPLTYVPSAGGELTAMALSPDDETLIAAGDTGVIWGWNVATGAAIGSWAGHQDRVMELAYFRDGRQFASACRDGQVRVWSSNLRATDMTVTDALPKHHPVSSLGLKFTPDSQTLYSASSDGTIVGWNVRTRTPATQYRLDQADLSCMHITPDGRRLIFGDLKGCILLVNAPTGRVEQTLTGHPRHVGALALSAEGRWLASGGGSPNSPVSEDLMEELFWWDLTNKGDPRRVLAHARYVARIAFSPDGLHLATAGRDKRIRIWQVPPTTPVFDFVAGLENVTALAYSPDGQWLVGGMGAGTLQRWKLNGASQPQPLAPLSRGDGGIHDLAFSPAGRTLAVAYGAYGEWIGVVHLWDTRTWEVKTTLTTEPGRVLRVCFSPDGQYLAAGHFSGNVYLWHAPRAPRE